MHGPGGVGWMDEPTADCGGERVWEKGCRSSAGLDPSSACPCVTLGYFVLSLHWHLRISTVLPQAWYKSGYNRKIAARELKPPARGPLLQVGLGFQATFYLQGTLEGKNGKGA